MAKSAFDIAKISPPMLKSVMPRVRLFDLMDRFRKRSAVWVSGPAGCGKTCAVASYIEKLDIPCLWYEMDEGDADPATFVYYMGLAAKKLSPRKRKPLPLLTPEYLQGLTTFSRRFFEAVYGRLNSPILFVFDNYQELPHDSPTQTIVRIGLESLPRDTNAIVISRSAPPSEFARLLANKKIGSMSWKQLRLNLDESTNIARLQFGKDLPKKTISSLHEFTDGWAAGYVLMLEAAKAEEIVPDAEANISQKELFNYFGTEVFDRLGKSTQQFLLKTAFLPKIKLSLAEELTGNRRADRILSELNRQNQFTERRFHSAPIYHYHPLFREFLMNKANQILDSKNILDLYRQAAGFYEKERDIESAIGLFIDIQDWDSAGSHIKEYGPHLLAQGRNMQLKSWLDKLPGDYVGDDPWLSYWMGMSILPYDVNACIDYLDTSYHNFKQSEELIGMLLSWVGLVDATIYSMNNFYRLDKLVKDVKVHLKNFDEIPSDEIKAKTAARIMIALYHRQPQNSAIEKWAQKAVELCEKSGDAQTKALTLFNYSHYLLLTEDYNGALYTFDELSRLVQAINAPPFIKISLKMLKATLQLLSGSHNECIKTALNGLRLSEKSGIYVWNSLMLSQAIHSSLCENNFEIANELFKHMEKIYTRLRPWELSRYHFLKGAELLIRGDYQQALIHADTGLNHDKKVGAPWSMALIRLLRAEILHAVGQKDQAEADLNHALKIVRKIKNRRTEHHALLLSAFFEIKNGYEEKFVRLLQKALAFGKKYNFIGTFSEVTNFTTDLYIRALEAGIEEKYIQEIIRQRRLIPDDPPLHLENWPWAIKIFTLGHFRLLKYDRPVQFTGKVQKKPLQLLKTLIAFGGQDVPEEKIIDELWPDTEGDLALQSLATTLHRLRKLLDAQEAIVVQNHCLTLDQRYCWVDIFSFERLMDHDLEAWNNENDMKYSAKNTKKAIELYRGDFLAEEALSPWIIATRTRIKDKFLQGLERLGGYLEKSDKMESALELYHKGLEIDPLVEKLYCLIMKCQIKLGNHSEAISTYNRCKEILETAFGVEPSAETETVRNSL